MFNDYKFSELVLKTKKIKGVTTNEYRKSGRYPVIDQGSRFIAGYSDSEESCYKDELPIVVFGDHTLSVKYVNFPFCVGADGTQIIKPNSSVITAKFLYYAIQQLNIQSRGYARHFKLLKESIFLVPEINVQNKITKILDDADSVRNYRNESIRMLDDYLKSVFIEIFGDPINNPKQWGKQPLANFGQIITGNTPSRNNPDNYSNRYIEWIKTDNIKENELYVTGASEYLSEKGLASARYVTQGALLVACIAGSANSIGRASLTDRKVSFNQQINAIQPNHDVNPLFLYWLFKLSREFVLSKASTGMKKILTKGVMQKISMILPPIEVQNEFASKVEITENLRHKMLAQYDELDKHFQALLQKAFRGSS